MSSHATRVDGRIRQFTIGCLIVTGAVAVVDAIAGRLILIGLLVVGPCLAVLTRQARTTAIVGGWAVVLAVVLGGPDHIWGTSTLAYYAGSVALVSGASTGMAALLEQRPGLLRGRAGEPAGPAPAGSDEEFVAAAFGAALKRPADAEALRVHVGLLRSGRSREEVLTGIVDSTEAARHLVYSPGVRSLAQEFWERRRHAGPDVRPIYFLHIMKTGGTSVAQALAGIASAWPRLGDLLLDHLVCLPRPLVNQALLVSGHLPYEAVELLPPGGALCTIVRDPVDRTLSHHAHLNADLAAAGRPGVTIDEFLADGRWGPLWRDYQVRQLAGRLGAADAWTGFSPVERAAPRDLSPSDRAYPLQSLFDSAPIDDAAALAATALARLDTFELVGVTDDLDALVGRAAAFWRQPAPAPIGRLRASDGRLRREDVPAATVAAIRAGTPGDAALYERARELALTRH